MLRGVGLKNALIVGLISTLFSMFFSSVHHMIPSDKFFGLYEASTYSRSIRSI